MKYEECLYKQIAIGCASIIVICICLFAMYYILEGRHV